MSEGGRRRSPPVHQAGPPARLAERAVVQPCRRLAIKPPESKINANATLMLIDLAQFLPVKGAGLLTR